MLTTGTVTRSTVTVLAVALAALGTLMVTGCGQVQETAHSAVSQAATAAAQQAAGQVREQICDRVADGTISDQDRTALNGLLGTAQKAGLPADVMDPLRAIATTDRTVPPKALEQLRTACAQT